MAEATSTRLGPSLRGGGWHLLGNYLKTALLLAALSAIILLVGQAIGGMNGIIIAAAVVLAMNFVSYWFSDRIALGIHRAQPLAKEDIPWLFDIVRQLSRRYGMPMPKLYLIPTDSPNAFATGRSPEHAAVAVTAGILRLCTPRELSGVLAHELAHVRNRDTLIGTVAATLAGVITWVAQMAFFWGGLFLGGRDDEGGNWLSDLGLILVAPIAATLIQLAVSRGREYQADATGARTLGDPDALADALEKLETGVARRPYAVAPATSHLFIVNPLSARAVMSLFSTHPPLEKRIQRLRLMAR